MIPVYRLMLNKALVDSRNSSPQDFTRCARECVFHLHFQFCCFWPFSEILLQQWRVSVSSIIPVLKDMKRTVLRKLISLLLVGTKVYLELHILQPPTLLQVYRNKSFHSSVGFLLALSSAQFKVLNCSLKTPSRPSKTCMKKNLGSSLKCST